VRSVNGQNTSLFLGDVKPNGRYAGAPELDHRAHLVGNGAKGCGDPQVNARAKLCCRRSWMDDAIRLRKTPIWLFLTECNEFAH